MRRYFVFAVLGLFFVFLFASKTPAQKSINAEAVVFEVKRGDTIDAVSKRLEREGVIDKAAAFTFYAKLKGKASSLKAGRYQIEAGEEYESILDKLSTGRSHQINITIPEGYTVFDIAALLERKGLVSGREFLAACRDDELLRKYSIPAGLSLEGYLYPETYAIPLGASSGQIVRMFTSQFDRVCASFAKKKFGGRSFHEIVTMASIVERESRIASERPLIAGVYYNRLKQNMRLQADPTLIYSLQLDGIYDGDIRREHFSYDSPYNTYRYSGLPPGPIGNPGISAIRAAMKPKKSDFIFFVARPDGTHKFSKTYDEHRKAVDEYQRKK